MYHHEERFVLYYILFHSYKVVEPADQMFGSPMPNGSWTGIFGMVQRKVRHMLTLCGTEHKSESSNMCVLKDSAF